MSSTYARTDALDMQREQVSPELVDTLLLQEISAQLITEGDSAALYSKIIDAAMSIMRSDFSSMQMLHPDERLELIAFRGFSSEAARLWKWIHADSSTNCGMALRQRERVITANVELCPVISGTSELDTFLAAGIHSCQTTPLLSRDGKLVGMLSTHWGRPHEPTERDLRLFDILARQAADLLERHFTEAALRASVEALREADARKNDFLAMLAHELRNPLAPLRSAAEILRHAGNDPRAVESVTGVLERQIGLMVRLVDDLLDASRIGRGKMELRCARTDLTAIIHQAVESVRPMCEAKRQHLVVNSPAAPVPLFADSARLTQAIGNLLTNASKFSNANDRIQIDVYIADQSATIRVTDDGVGIASDQLPRIFDLFAQADTSVARAHSGLGIGLSLVKTFVEMHGGTVSADSAGRDKGSEFTIRLPLNPPATD